MLLLFNHVSAVNLTKGKEVKAHEPKAPRRTATPPWTGY